MSIFSKNLRFLRKKGNYNQDEISILFNKKANTIGNWENEKSEPSLSELMKLGEHFHVSTQDLLFTDLEKESFHHSEHTDGGPGSAVQKFNSYPLQEPLNSMAREAGPDAFWLILRELRTVNEKLDFLNSAIKSDVFKKNTDKSYY